MARETLHGADVAVSRPLPGRARLPFLPTSREGLAGTETRRKTFRDNGLRLGRASACQVVAYSEMIPIPAKCGQPRPFPLYATKLRRCRNLPDKAALCRTFLQFAGGSLHVALIAPTPFAMHCTALHGIALQRDALHVVASHCRSLQCIARRCTALHATWCNDATKRFPGERVLCLFAKFATRLAKYFSSLT